jgi:hypothetical protein
VKYHVRDIVYMMIVTSFLRGTLGNAPRVVFILPRGTLGNAPRVVFIPRGTLGNAPRVVFLPRGTLGNAPHGVFFSIILVDDDPRDDNALVKFLVDDDPGDALVKSSFARLHKSMSTAFSIELIFYHRENEGFVFPQLRKGIG